MKKNFWEFSYSKKAASIFYVDRQGGRGGFQKIYVNLQGGGGVPGQIYVDHLCIHLNKYMMNLWNNILKV